MLSLILFGPPGSHARAACSRAAREGPLQHRFSIQTTIRIPYLAHLRVPGRMLRLRDVVGRLDLRGGHIGSYTI